jgi:hypothetical protein
MNRKLTLVLALICLVATVAPVVAQDLHPSRRPSPMAMARVTLDGGVYVRVVYSRPYLRGRDNIFGTKESEALVPLGKLWRTGANEATEITVTGDVMVGDAKLAAGTYSVFSTPGTESWEIHFNTALGLSGSFGRNPETGEFESMYKAENNAASVKVPAGVYKPGEGDDEEVDQFTIAFEKVDGGAHMVMRWQKTEVRVPFKLAG